MLQHAPLNFTSSNRSTLSHLTVAFVFIFASEPAFAPTPACNCDRDRDRFRSEETIF